MAGSTNKTTLATAATIAGGALLLGAVALVGNSEEISYPDTFDSQAAHYEAGTAIVVSKRVTEGSKILGFEIREADYGVDVAFTIPGEDCFFILADQEEWPVADGRCVSPRNVSGTVSGLGNTPEGDTYVGVTISVGEECYTAIELGMEWQSTPGFCA